MGLGALREKQLVKWNGRIIRMDGRMPDGQWHCTELGTGLMDKQSESAFWLAFEMGELQFLSDGDVSDCREADNLLDKLSTAASLGTKVEADGDTDGDEASHRLVYVQALKGVTGSDVKIAIDKAWKRLGWPVVRPGVSTVMGWRSRASGKSDPVAALRDRDDRKGRHGPRYHGDVLVVMREVRDLKYLRKTPRISLKKAVQIAGDKIKLINKTRPESQRLPIPKRRAFVSVVKEVDAAEVLARRYGADVAMRMMRTSLGGVRTSRPLERVEIDHTVLAIILLDEDFTPLGRAFVTAAKDAHTRAVPGFYWGWENPSVVSLARCLRLAMSPKGGFLSAYPSVKSDWPCWGVAETWVIDNGMEEHASAIRQAASECGVQKVEFCARAAPWQKPNIERYFRQQDQALLQNLPGATMENISAKTDFDPRKDMLVRRSTFGRLIVKWLVDVYMRERQAILKNKSPYDMCKASEGTFTPFMPTKTTLLERLFLRQLDDRLLDHAGVEYDCLVYNSLDMKVVREKLGARLKLSIRVSDEDVGFIYVGVPGYDVWVKVPCLDQDYACGLTRWQHTKCKKMQKACIDEGLELSLAEARNMIEEEIEDEAGAVKQGRKKARARMMEKDSSKTCDDNDAAPPNAQQRTRAVPEPAEADCDDIEDEVPDFEVERLERTAQ